MLKWPTMLWTRDVNGNPWKGNQNYYKNKMVFANNSKSKINNVHKIPFKTQMTNKLALKMYF